MKKVTVVISSLVLGTVIAAGTVFTLASPAKKAETTPTTSTTLVTTTAPATEQTKKYISAEKAQSIAMADANVSKKDVTFKKTKLELDDGIYQFDVEFYVGRTEYDYSIDAVSGAILDKEIDTDEEHTTVPSTVAPTTAAASTTQRTTEPPKTTAQPKTTQPEKTTAAPTTTKKTSRYISAAKAKSIALSDAGIKSSQALFTKVKLDRDDGITEYEIEFHVGKTEYEYSIDASTGKILERDIEREESVPTTKAVTTTKKTAQNKFISVSKAKAIALAHAGVSEKNVSFKKVKLEKDDGIYEYEVEFYVGNWEYEYSINAKTGKILDFEKELDD